MSADAIQATAIDALSCKVYAIKHGYYKETDIYYCLHLLTQNFYISGGTNLLASFQVSFLRIVQFLNWQRTVQLTKI